MSESAVVMQGAWCVGSGGAERLGHLSRRLFEKTVQARRARGDEVRSYLPWFSCDDFADQIRISTVMTSSDRILKEPSILRKMRRVYWGSKAQPLGGVSIPSKSMSIDVRATDRDLSTLERAIELVRSTDESWSARFSSLVQAIIPLKGLGKNVREGGVGFSTQFAKGAIFLSIPKQANFRAVELSINLAHEMGHQALMVYQSADRIVSGDLAQPVYSGVRKTNRPAIQSFHALVALIYMVEYTINRLKNNFGLDTAETEYLRQRHESLLTDLEISITSFKDVGLTMLGANLYQEAKSVAASARAIAR